MKYILVVSLLSWSLFNWLDNWIWWINCFILLFNCNIVGWFNCCGNWMFMRLELIVGKICILNCLVIGERIVNVVCVCLGLKSCWFCSRLIGNWLMKMWL